MIICLFSFMGKDLPVYCKNGPPVKNSSTLEKIKSEVPKKFQIYYSINFKCRSGIIKI